MRILIIQNGNYIYTLTKNLKYIQVEFLPQTEHQSKKRINTCDIVFLRLFQLPNLNKDPKKKKKLIIISNNDHHQSWRIDPSLIVVSLILNDRTANFARREVYLRSFLTEPDLETPNSAAALL